MLERARVEEQARADRVYGRPEKPRTGKLYRRTDVSGISGTGPVAWIVEFPDGSAAMRWNKSRTGLPGTCTAYEYGVPQIIGIHGHDGMSHVIWDD